MRKSGIIIIICLLVGCAAYIFINCVVKIDDDTMGISRDLKSGKVTLLGRGYNFIWLGAIQGRTSLECIKKKNVDLFDLRIKIKSLEDLNDDRYSIGISINIIYDIDENASVSLYGRQSNSLGSIFLGTIQRYLKGNLEEEMMPYLSPGYRRNDILREKEGIIDRAVNKLKDQCRPVGINISGHGVIGGINLPESGAYYEGLNYCMEIRERERNNKKELIILNGRLEREKSVNKLYYEKLSDISKLIGHNPDLLKYIYIEKMADDVKVILAPEKSGIPLGLGSEAAGKEERNAGEVDNLK